MNDEVAPAYTVVDLDAMCNAATGGSGGSGGCAGQAVRVGFTGITDCSVTADGWFLDTVSITAGAVNGTPVPNGGAGITPASVPAAMRSKK